MDTDSMGPRTHFEFRKFEAAVDHKYITSDWFLNTHMHARLPPKKVILSSLGVSV